ncbi:MAG: hypothetical protein R3F19_07075 [Verrucomicrobiales bacterium]
MSSAAEECNPAARLTDFSDWLSPMLVKELRQGLRTKVFVVAFIVLQGLLSMVLFFSLDGNSSGSSYSFWFVSAVLLVGVMPLRGFAALSDEIEDNTLDLIMITRLSSLRIAFGKWSALVVQTLLLCVTILPYVIMRYFLGGIDLKVELTAFFYLFLLSSVLSALTIAFSVFPSFLVRSALAMVVGSLAARFTGQLIDFQSIPAEWLSPGSLMVAVFASGYASWFLLEFGASRIASAAENHAVRKRLVSMVVVTIVAALSDPAWRVLPLALALIPVVDALAEPINVNRSVLLPFVRRGFFGRVAGRLLYPGWSSGVWFTLVMAGIVVPFDAFKTPTPESLVQWLAWPAAALLPVPVLWILEKWKPPGSRFGLYMIVQSAVSSLGFGVLLVATASRQHWVALVACALPNGALAATFGDQYADLLWQSPELTHSVVCVSTGCIVLVSLMASWLGFRSVCAAEREIGRSTRSDAELD